MHTHEDQLAAVVLASKKGVKVAAESYGVNPQTIRNWKARLDGKASIDDCIKPFDIVTTIAPTKYSRPSEADARVVKTLQMLPKPAGTQYPSFCINKHDMDGVNPRTFMSKVRTIINREFNTKEVCFRIGAQKDVKGEITSLRVWRTC